MKISREREREFGERFCRGKKDEDGNEENDKGQGTGGGRGK